MKRRVSVIAALLTAAAACTATDMADTEADVDAIRAVIAQRLESIATMDMDMFTATWADDVMVVPPNEPAVAGEAAIEWAMGFAARFASAEASYSDEEIVVSGDWAIHTYASNMSFAPVGGGDPMVSESRGIHVFRRQADGSWKIVHDLWNGNAPPPPGM